MKKPRIFAAVVLLTAAGLTSAHAQTLRKADIAPPADAPPAGAYTPGAGGAFTLTGPGTAFPPNMTLGNGADINATGDAMTFAYEEIVGDFDRRVQVTGIAADAGTPNDPWTRAGLMVRTGLEHYRASLQLVASNPKGSANEVRFTGRALDGQNYTQFSRSYTGVAKVLPNQWLRLRRVGDYFAAYIGTNGTSWTLAGERYQEWPARVYVGAYAASGSADVTATVQYSGYSAVPVNDTLPPRLVSAGTIDKKLVGVKFSELVDSATATDPANYRLSQGSITRIKTGIGGDAVYLEVTGLTADNFTVTVLGGVKDTAGNVIAANSVAQARALNWVSQDLGRIQDPNNRPKAGDDPYRVGRAVMVSSDENPEVEVVAGGSNAWNPGDYIHYLYREEPLSGDFDVTIAVSRYDRSANQGGYSNSGLMLRVSPYLAGEEYTAVGTQVPMVANTTYLENSVPGRGAIPLWRTSEHGGYGNGKADFSWQTLIGGIRGYYAGLRAVDASGAVDTRSSAESARYLRIKRTGKTYFFYASWDGKDWAQVDRKDLPELPDKLLLGFSTMTDSGSSEPPFSAYVNNGHQIDPNDPLNPERDPSWPGGRSYMNESNYAAQRIKVFPKGVTTPLPVALATTDILHETSTALTGSWTSTGTYSFDMTGGGSGAFRNMAADGSGGDELTYAYEEIEGDFDKQLRVVSIGSTYFAADGSAYTPAEGEVLPVDAWARGGLMIRATTNVHSANLKIVAGNPAGANELRVMGRGLDGQNYTAFGRSYPGVTNALPNQWMRVQRVGNAFTFYISKEGVDWVPVAQRVQEMPAKVLVGAYAAAALNPDDSTGNPNGLKARAVVKFADYKNVNLGDLVPPQLVSVGSLDRKTVGVKFSEAVSSATATVAANYTLSQGTVSAVRMGIGGDAVYLTVNGLTSDTFSVTVNGVKDTAGNPLAPSTAQGKVQAWMSQDIGSIQNPNNRPTVGDDPYRVGQAVALSSDENTEVEIIGGGSNAWNSGDFLHYLYKSGPLTGDFDVAVAVQRYDRSANQGGYSNSGLMLRASPYLAGQENTPDGTKVPMMANVTYLENSAPGRGAIPLWRTDAGGGYGNGKADFAWTTLIGGIKGYYGAMRAMDATGARDPESSPDAARWLRIKREGSKFSFFASWDGVNWNNYDNTDQPALAGPLLLGFSTMTDSGSSLPPFSAYGGNGHALDPADPLNPAVAGGNVMNEANYAAQRIRLFPKGPVSGPPGPIAIVAAAGGQVTLSWPGAATLQSASSVTGPWSAAPNQANPQTVAPSGGQTFYRLAR